MSKLELYRSHLKAEGYACEAHDDHVAFKHEGGTYVLTVDDSDPCYFQLVFPKFFPIADAAQRARAQEVAARVNMLVKGAKVFDIGNDTCAAIEIFLPRPEDFRAILPRALRALQAGTQHFCMAMAVGAMPGLLEGLRQMLAGGREVPPKT
jgi:hypothetical protein